MALIKKTSLDCVVELGYATKQSATVSWIGTGLLYGDDIQTDELGASKFMPYLLTNRHVLEIVTANSDKLVVRFRKKSGGSQHFLHPLKTQLGTSLWQCHPNTAEVDAAAMRIALHVLDAEQYDFLACHPDLLWRKKTMQEKGCSEGDRVLVVGYPYSIEQISPRSRAYPVVRGGIVSRVSDLYASEAEFFLIDATIYPGNSGSPVYTVPEAGSMPGTKCIQQSAIIGFVSEYLDYRDLAVSESTQRPRVYFIENSGLAKVETVDSMLDALVILRGRLKQEADEHNLLAAEDVPVQE